MEEYDEIDKLLDEAIDREFSDLIVNEIGPYTCILFKMDDQKKEQPFAVIGK